MFHLFSYVDRNNGAPHTLITFIRWFRSTKKGHISIKGIHLIELSLKGFSRYLYITSVRTNKHFDVKHLKILRVTFSQHLIGDEKAIVHNHQLYNEKKSQVAIHRTEKTKKN